MADSMCAVDGCVNPVRVKVRGLCSKHNKAWVRYGDPAGPPNPTCKTCGEQFERPGRSGVMPRYCSRECNPRYKPDERPCKFCGEPFRREGSNREHCSTSCRDRWRRNGHKPLGDHLRTCAGCGETIDFNELGRAGRKRRLDANYCLGCRRNANYPLTVGELAKRDGPKCSICGGMVDLTVPWPEPMSPTVDHVIPWSISRSNAPENLALAHSTCNRRKRDNVA